MVCVGHRASLGLALELGRIGGDIRVALVWVLGLRRIGVSMKVGLEEFRLPLG